MLEQDDLRIDESSEEDCKPKEKGPPPKLTNVDKQGKELPDKCNWGGPSRGDDKDLIFLHKDPKRLDIPRATEYAHRPRARSQEAISIRRTPRDVVIAQAIDQRFDNTIPERRTKPSNPQT